jgi:hypothetical protein
VQRCQRSFTGSCSFSTIAANVPPNTTFIDNTVTSVGTYRFRVRACNAMVVPLTPSPLRSGCDETRGTEAPS